MSTPLATAKAPSSVFLALVAVAERKAYTPFLTMLIMALYASFWIDLGAILAIYISGQLGMNCGWPVWKTDGCQKGAQNFAFGALFPLGLILIFFVGAELFTGDTMYMVAGLLAKKTTWWDLIKVWAIAWFGNFFGAALMAIFFGYLGEMATANGDVQGTYISKTHTKITGMGWGVVLLKAILCNTLVNCAVWGAGVCDDTAGKILAIWWPIMAFAACGYEHSVANMFMCSAGLMVGAVDYHVDFGFFLGQNLIPCTLGNIFGGSIAMAVAWWYCYSYSPPGSLPGPTPAAPVASSSPIKA